MAIGLEESYAGGVEVAGCDVKTPVVDFGACFDECCHGLGVAFGCCVAKGRQAD
ncbi:hypothetical protein B0T16DRAFT_411331 [Cercophora newfieldiana]|uniref:Uncharacterized protein n=1 Tax=Cercophora newfieldiana TaxID=92897 RepID=A0AA39Y4Z9_9PEZI|nr:hypothetical protein B0T16DRAFT_411331 [Cercophora newfieldiana]